MGRGGQNRVGAAGPVAGGRREPLAGASVRELGEVFHLGSLEAADKSRYFSGSHEGHGLSVSLDPDAWRRIARLGGSRLWTLRNPAGRFLEAHELSDRERERISDWAVAAGYAERTTAWIFSYFDDELDDEVTFTFKDRAEAVEEAGDCETAIREGAVIAPTAALAERIAMSSPIDCFDHLLGIWVEDEREALDGVWWEDGYGPYSAPRGVIVPSRLERWQPTPEPGVVSG